MGLFDLHALSLAAPGRLALYHDCAHLRAAPPAYALYARLGRMLGALRAQVYEGQAGALCASARCRAHNAGVAPPGAPFAERYDFGGALPGLGAADPADEAAAGRSGRRRLRREARAPRQPASDLFRVSQ